MSSTILDEYLHRAPAPILNFKCNGHRRTSCLVQTHCSSQLLKCTTLCRIYSVDHRMTSSVPLLVFSLAFSTVFTLAFSLTFSLWRSPMYSPRCEMESCRPYSRPSPLVAGQQLQRCITSGFRQQLKLWIAIRRRFTVDARPSRTEKQCNKKQSFINAAPATVCRRSGAKAKWLTLSGSPCTSTGGAF